MATLSNLRISVNKASPTEDQSTYKYHVQLQLGEIRWEVTKRFSEFDQLLQGLSNNKYAGLPKLPAKTLLGSPTDTSAIGARKEQLSIILQDLVCRPDTRTSVQVRRFLNMDSHIETAVRSVLPEAVRTFEDPRFGVSGLAAAPTANLMLITHEDSTHLSRLGRVWSVVEPDELGALHLWTRTSEGVWKRVHTRTFGIKVRSLCWEDTTRQFFIGLEDGKIEVHEIPVDSLVPKSKAVLELHHKSPVTYLAASSKSLLSLGFDTAMRTIDIRTRELTCGGRLLKRLRREMDYLTTGHLDADEDRAFIGTSGGDVFILDIARNPPTFLHTIVAGNTAVSAVAVVKESFLVAHGDCVTVYSFVGKTQEGKIQKMGSHRSKHIHADEATILSLAVSEARGLVFGGYSDGCVAIWSTRESEAFIVLQAHQCDCTRLVWMETAPWGPGLLSGGGDGKVITWKLAAEEEGDYEHWAPQGVDSSDFSLAIPAETIGAAASYAGGGGSSDTLSAFEPSWGNAGTSDAFTIATNPRVNPQALKRDDESDSDNDITDAFH